MGILESAILGGIGGLFDYGSAKETNRANIEAAKEQADRERESTERGFGALTGSGPGYRIDREGQGFKVSSDIGDALLSGDFDRIGRLNEATRNFNFTLPSLDAARGVINRDQQLQDVGLRKGRQDIAKLNQRQFGGLGHSGQQAAGIDALTRFAAQNQLGGETEAINLFGMSRAQDNAVLSQLIENMSPRVFTAGIPGPPGQQGSTAAIQKKAPQVATDLGPAIPGAIGGNFIQQLQNQIAAQEGRERQEALIERMAASNQTGQADLIRLLANAGAFGTV